MKVGLRCYLDVKPRGGEKAPTFVGDELVMCFDTETTIDQYQNLKFGSCGIWESLVQRDSVIFYDPDYCSGKEVEVLKSFEQYMPTRVMTKEEFLGWVFFPTLCGVGRAICVGFNLFFDFSRLAMGYTKTSYEKEGFSFYFSKDKWYPRVIIKNLDSKRSFINLTVSEGNVGRGDRDQYRGFFTDMRTLMFALTNRKYTLKMATRDFECATVKGEALQHGIITPEYVDYNKMDMLSTHDLYEKAIERYGIYGLERGVNRLYSPASIGKAYLDKIGVKSMLKKNPMFPKHLLGYIMSTFYGARTELWVRKTPIKVTYLDFTSMYPSMYALFNMDAFLKAERIGHKDTTEETQRLLDMLTRDDLTDKTRWRSLITICRLKPNGDVLPVRAKFNETTFTNAVSVVKSDVSLWYTLPELLASKFATDRTPRIEEAITFTPEGVQTGLREIEILKGLPCKPQEDLIKKLIEDRLRTKKEKQKHQEDSKEWKDLDLKQNILKIIANAISYGIYIEVNPKDLKGKEKEEKVPVYGLETFDYPLSTVETSGEAFNPIIATFLTAGSRLILAMAESLLKDIDGKLVYCDTDSVFVTPEHVKPIQDYFSPLNPYDIQVPMFKVEDDKVEDDAGEEDPDDLSEADIEQPHKARPLDNVWFYGISSKRYVLYDRDPKSGNITIRKYSSHGLGHLLFKGKKKYWLRKIWNDILTIHYHPEKRSELLEDYENMYAIMRLSVSKYSVIERLKVINEGKPYAQQIKPGNFVLVGTSYNFRSGIDEKVNPLVPYVSPDSPEFDMIPFDSFTDYKTGDYYSNQEHPDTHLYWKPFVEVLKEYINHPEIKLEGETELRRRHITIKKEDIRYIGKESNQLEEYMKIGITRDAIDIFLNLEELIMSIDVKTEAEKVGLPARTIYDHQQKIRSLRKEGKKFDPSSLQKEVRDAYIAYFS